MSNWSSSFIHSLIHSLVVGQVQLNFVKLSRVVKICHWSKLHLQKYYWSGRQAWSREVDVAMSLFSRVQVICHGKGKENKVKSVRFWTKMMLVNENEVLACEEN